MPAVQGAAWEEVWEFIDPPGLSEAEGRGLPPGRQGKGWTQGAGGPAREIPLAFRGARRGAVCFELLRGHARSPEFHSVFELLDAQGERVPRARLAWASDRAGGNPLLLVQGARGMGDYYREGLVLWGPLVPLNEPVARGQWIRVDLTWDEPAGTYGVCCP